MKRILATLSLLIVAFGVGAQDEMAPPPPLDDEHFAWMVGEWKGSSDSPMGKSEDSLTCEMGLGGQFLVMHFTSNSAMGKFTGMGALTLAADGNIQGVWVDSWRTISKGTGSRDGKTTTMVWESAMGNHTRVMTKVGNEKYVETVTMMGPEGEMHAKSEMTRVKSN